MQSTVRKTISFPSGLARKIEQEAKTDRRKFSPQVVKVLEELFLTGTVRQSKAKGGAK